MNDCIDFSSVVPLSQMRGDSDTDTVLLNTMAEKAKTFVQAFDWCKSIEGSYFGCGVGSVVGVFFFRIVPATEGVDECLWVVIGDIPPAYLVTDESRTPGAALRTYIGEMKAWVVAVEKGRPVEELIPVDAPATLTTALALRKRLDFLEIEILPGCR
jgi:hypothetical protein